MSTPATIRRPCPIPPPVKQAGWRPILAPLRIRGFRLFLIGQVSSNAGGWVQRIAQDWLVLTVTGSTTAVGVTTALQLAPTLVLGPAGGLIADRYPKRRVLLGTQTAMASMAGILAVLTATNQVQVWQIYVLATCLGVVIAVDKPTQQALVTELVGQGNLRAAVSLHASVFQFGGLVGPAISGVLIHVVGTGYAFGINALSFLAPMITIYLIREHDLQRPAERVARSGGQLQEAVRYVFGRKDALWPIVLAGVFGLFTTNLPNTLAAYAKEFLSFGPTGYALLNTLVAVGSLGGALASARFPIVRLRSIVAAALLLAAGYVLASVAPNVAILCVLLVPIGASTALLLTSVSSAVQLAVSSSLRGRVIGVYLLVFVGSGAVGGPVLGIINQSFGPQAALLVSGLVPGFATLVVAWKLAQQTGQRVRFRPQALSEVLVIVPR